MQFPAVGPEAVLGIELNPYAAELARVVVWIGEIQWMLNNGFAYVRDPILRPLNNIECRDAVLTRDADGKIVEPQWPAADVVLGNPPFLGAGERMRAGLGDAYVDQLAALYAGRVPRTADLVTYWHEKTRAMIEAGEIKRAGLLATQGIRHAGGRPVLDRIKQTGDIFLAWADEKWVVDGAAVHVSLIGFDDGSQQEKLLEGQPVTAINADLTQGVDYKAIPSLAANAGIAFEGAKKGGPFEIPAEIAATMFTASNPDGRSNADVIRPWMSGRDILARPRGLLIIDFAELPETEAALYQEPFEHVRKEVLPVRSSNRRPRRKKFWWQHSETVPGIRAATAGLTRFIVTVNVSKHRLFVWADGRTLPSNSLVLFATDEDYDLGVLHSRAHEMWSRRLGGQVRDSASGFRYTSACFDTFPYPDVSGTARDAIAAAAQRLSQLRIGYLNPPGADEEVLRRRGLTKLYNDRPSWLAMTHRDLDAAVHAAYGWEPDLPDEQVLEQLVALNATRAGV